LEADVVLPQTVYGKSKLAGENYVRSKLLSYTILRMSPIFGLGSIYHPSAFDQLRRKLQAGMTTELAAKEVHSFLSLEIALKAVEWAATNEMQNRTYNLGGLTKLSWYEFGVNVAKAFGFNPDLVVPGKGAFDEDMDFSLNGSELVRQLQIDPLVLEQGLDLLKQQLIRGGLPGDP
ncbi:MAG: sugar nucleotide-binding protein, partial [Deltaproteobacteria bacterium]|nr:sugar nucleotide-binding protein [Deltaproteobacteria bacterium]